MSSTPPAPAPTSSEASVSAMKAFIFSRVTSTTSYVEQPVTHRIQNVGTSFFHLIAVLNQTSGEDATTPRAYGLDYEPVEIVTEDGERQALTLWYADALPAEAKHYVRRIEEVSGVPCPIVSTGSDRAETIVREDSVVTTWLPGALR